jgi:ribonuclease T
MTQIAPITLATRFRGFLPVVIDVETGGFNSQTDALLEIAAVFLEMRSDGTLLRVKQFAITIPFPGANMEAASLAVNGIDPHHPLRPAIPEEDALQRIFREVRNAIRAAECTRAVLVGHNAFFDLNFLNAAVARAQVKRNPFHPFSSFDTATPAASRSPNCLDARNVGGRPTGHGVAHPRLMVARGLPICSA